MTSVLIVDDEPGIREVFQSILEEEGYDVTTAADFFEAESALAAHPYDVVVTDIIMPRVNGLTLLRRVREIDVSIPVIMITGEPDIDTATDAVRHGAYDYISKPITLDTLTRAVARAVERKQLLDEKRRLEVENLAYQSDLERKVAERATELEQRHQELATLIEISRAMSATLDPVKVMEIVAENVVTRLGYKAALVSFYAEEDNSFTMGAVYPRGALLKRAIKLVGYDPWKLKFSFDPQVNPGFKQLLEGQVWLSTSFHDFVRPVLSKRVADAMQRLYGTDYNVNVPMWVRGKLVGTIMAARKDEIDAQAQKVLASLARQAALAVENGRLFEAERAQLLLAQTLQEVGALLTASLSLDEVCQHVFDLLSRVIKYDSVSLQLLGQDNQLSLLAARGFPDPELSNQVARELSDHVLEKFEERKVIVIPDTLKDSRWIVVPEVDYIRSWIGAPLLVKGKLIGVLNVDSATVNAYDAALGETVMAFANQAAIAIENTRLFDEEMDSRRLADTLRQVAQALNSTLSLDDVLGLILTELEKVIPLDSGSIMLLEGKDLIVRSVKGFADPDSVLKARLDLDTALLNREVVESKRPLIVGSVHGDERWINAMKFSGLEPELHATCSWMGIPLIVKGQVIGMLTTDKRQAHFYSERDAQVALTFANQAATAIENARLFETTSQHVAELEAVRQASLHLTSSLELQPVLEAILEHALKLVSADDAHVFFYDGERLTFGAAMWAGGRQQEPYSEPRPRGLTYAVARSGERVVVPDMKDHPLFQDGRWDEWTGAIVGMPLHIGDRVQGVMNVAFEGPHPFSKDNLRTLELLADQAAIAIENARLFGAEQRRRQEAETLCRAAQALATTTLDLSQIFERILGELQQVVPYDSASVQLLKGNRLKIIGGRGFPNLQDLLGVSFDLSREDNPNREVIRRRVSFIVDDVPAVYSNFRRDPHAAAGIRAWLGVPLLFGDRLIGMLALDKREIGFYTAEHARLAEAFAAQAAIAIENALLFEKAQRELTERKRAEAALQERAASLELVARVAQRTTAILELDELLHQAVDLISDAFGYYNVVILLVEGDEVVGKAATLLAAQAMEDRLRLRVGKDGITGWVAGSGEPLLVPDVSVDSRYCAVTEGIKTKSELAVPIKLKGIVIGVLDVQSAELDAFSQADVFMLQTIADQLSVAIGNARLFEETTRRLNDLSLLHDVALIGAATLDFDQILHHTVESVRNELQLDVFGFLLIDEEAKVARLHPAFLGLPDEMADFTIPLGEGITGWVAQTGRPLLASDVSKDPRYLDAVPNIRSEICVPLKVSGKVIGVIDAESTQPDAFSEEHVRLFSTLAAQLGMALENARLFEETKRRLAEARLIQEVMLAAASTLDFDLVLERVVKALNRALGIFHLGFLVPNERNDALVPHPFLADLEEAAFQVSIEGSLLGRAYRTGQPVLVRDMAQEPACQEAASDVCSTLAVPVRVGDRIVAVLYAQSPQAGAFDEDELRLFTTIAGQLGVTLENARLYQRLEVQAAELSQAYSELQEINRLRIELVQNVSHELRTPLGLIKGYAALLLDGDLGPVLDSQRMALQVIHDRVVTLTRLIHNLTMLQALPQEALSLAPLSLVEVVQHALVEFRSLAKKTGITFLDELPEELPPVLGNQEQLGLAFGHLLDNAVKFSPDGGTVTLRAWADQEMVRVLVADEGIGISSEHLNRVFERFYQVDGSTSRRFGGMGVGLALVWEIIEAHGGTVNVDSEVGEGSQFIVALPQATGS